MSSELCKSCIHQQVCMLDKNMIGDVYIAPNPWFFDEEYKKNSWEHYLEWEKQGFPCEEYFTKDAEPVRHGHWQRLNFLMVGCSECRNLFAEEYAYCPHCGAKMDEEVK